MTTITLTEQSRDALITLVARDVRNQYGDEESDFVVDSLNRHLDALPNNGRIRVTYDELYKLWMGPDAVGILVDQQTNTKVVTMRGGTQYEAPIPAEGGES